MRKRRWTDHLSGLIKCSFGNKFRLCCARQQLYVYWVLHRLFIDIHHHFSSKTFPNSATEKWASLKVFFCQNRKPKQLPKTKPVWRNIKNRIRCNFVYHSIALIGTHARNRYERCTDNHQLHKLIHVVHEKESGNEHRRLKEEAGIARSVNLPWTFGQHDSYLCIPRIKYYKNKCPIN